MFNNVYPYTDFHEMNLDWFLKQFKELVTDWEDFHSTITQEWNDYKSGLDQEWADVQEAWTTLYNYVHDYFDNLDVQAEIDHKLDEMAADGSLLAVIQNTIVITTGGWLADHITNPSSPPLDDTLSIANAAAESKATGDRIAYLTANNTIVSNVKNPAVYTAGYYVHPGNGTITAASGWNASDYIPLTDGISYWIGNISLTNFAFYDEGKQFVDLRSDPAVCTNNQINSTFVVPTGIKYIRVSVINANINYAYVSDKALTDIYTTIDDAYDNKHLYIEPVAQFITNKYNPASFIAGTYGATYNPTEYNSSTTVSGRYTMYAYYDMDLICDGTIYIHFFDAAGTHLSETGWVTEYHIPKGSYYRIIIRAAAAADLETIVDLVTITATDYESTKYIPSCEPSAIFMCRDGRVTADVPPDSVYAIKMTAENQYDKIRFSVTKTTDGEYVAVHDTTINNLAVNPDGTAISGTIYTNQCSLAQLNNYDWGLKFGAEYAGLQVPMLEDCLIYANRYNLSVALDFKWNPSDSEIDEICTLLAKSNQLDAIIIGVPIATNVKFSNKSKKISHYFNGSEQQIIDNAYWFTQLKSTYNHMYIQPNPFGSAPADSVIELAMQNDYDIFMTPIEGLTALINMGFNKGIKLYECHYISNIKTALRAYFNSQI